MRLRIAFSMICLYWTAEAVVVDRIAIVVANRPVKSSDIEEDIRLTSFLNREKPDFSLKSRRDSASRLIDQQLIRREIESAQQVLAPPVADADRLLQQIRKERYPDDAAFKKGLTEYGITEADLKTRLQWQLSVLRFVDSRFRPEILLSDEEIQKYFEEHEKELRDGNPGAVDGVESFRPQIESTISGERINQQFYAWLEQRRKETKVVFREEALR